MTGRWGFLFPVGKYSAKCGDCDTKEKMGRLSAASVPKPRRVLRVEKRKLSAEVGKVRAECHPCGLGRC